MLAEFHDLERKHEVVKQQYETELLRLKGQPTSVPGASTVIHPSSALPSTNLAHSSAMVNKRRQLPDSTTQPSYAPTLPSEQHALPAMFSRPQPTGAIAPSPVESNSQGTMRLMSISTLPTPGAAGHVPIPAMNAAVGMGRAPMAGKVGGMAIMAPNGTGREALTHAMKKDVAMNIGSGMCAMGAPTGVSSFVAPGGRAGVLGAATVTTQTQGEPDWQVFNGRSANGSPVRTKVDLQHSIPLDSVVCCVRYSWDGQLLALGANRTARIYNANTGQSVAQFSKDPGPERDVQVTQGRQDSYVRAVCFSPDGQWLITGAEDHVVKVWDVRNRKVKHRLEGHGTDIYSVDTSANGQFIISGSGDKKAKLWSLDTGELLTTLGGEYGPTDGITSVSVSPTSQHVAAGSLDKVVRVWDVESSRLVRNFEGHRDSVYSVAFSPDGRMLLSGSLDRTLKLWDLAASQQSSQCRLSFTGHKDFVLSVAFSPNGRWLISGSKDRTVQFWDPRQSTTCLRLEGHKNSVISIAHNPVTKSLATGSGDCRARTWMYSST